MAASHKHGRMSGGATALSVAMAVLAASPAWATDAGSRITNIATARYGSAGAIQAVDSNSVALIVAERLDVTLARAATAPLPQGAGTPVAVLLANGGNGHEAFAIQVSGVAGGAATVAIDRDGDGRYDPAVDTALTDGHTPEIAPGATLALVIVADTGAVAPGGVVTIGAVALTGSGTPGTVIADRGDGGGDAVVGVTGAAATLAIPVAAAAPPTLVKSQSVLAPDGSSRPVRGAIVTYVLDAGFAVAADDARIDDPVPAGTRYVAGSLRLDGVALADAGDGSAVHVALGPVPRPVTRRIQFQVQIQ